MLGKEGCARSDLLDFREFLCTGSVDSSSLSFVWSGTQCPVTEQTVVQWTSGGLSPTRLQRESFPNRFLVRWTRQAWRLCLWLSRTPFLGWLSSPFFPCSKKELVKGEGNEQGGYRSKPISGKAVQNSRILGLHLKQLETSLHVAVVQRTLGKIVKWYDVVIFVAYWYFFLFPEASLQKMWASSVWQVQYQTVKLPNHGIWVPGPCLWFLFWVNQGWRVSIKE